MKQIETVKRKIEDLLAEHYSDVEIQNILRKKSIDVGLSYIMKVRNDAMEPLSWKYNDPRWDE